MLSINDLLTTAEVAKELKLDRSYVLRLMQAGKLTPVRKLPGYSGSYLFARHEVEDLAIARSEAEVKAS